MVSGSAALPATVHEHWTRLTGQKGLDLVEQVVPEMMMQRRFAMAILGSGEPHYEHFFSWLQQRYPDRVCFYCGFNNKLAHHIEAGSDMFLMPSRFEPCGLNQMYRDPQKQENR